MMAKMNEEIDMSTYACAAELDCPDLHMKGSTALVFVLLYAHTRQLASSRIYTVHNTAAHGKTCRFVTLQKCLFHHILLIATPIAIAQSLPSVVE